MKNAESLIKDFSENEELRKKFREVLNKLRCNGNLSVVEAEVKKAYELDYKISGDEAKKFITRVQSIVNAGKAQLSYDY